MVLVDSRRIFTVEVRVRSQFCTCEICGEQSGLGKYPFKHIILPMLHLYLYL
jgi:hypothetical protein